MDRIVVGVDGSDSAITALRWAVQEAERHDATVVAVLAWSYLDQRHADHSQEFDPAYTAQEAQDALRAAVEAVGSPRPIEQVTICDLPVQALLEASDGADLMVVGARGLGGFKGLLLGSVSERMLERAPCPVAIIRETGTQGPEAAVVVGIDGSPEATAALHWAAAEARARQAPLRVVHAWHVPFLAPAPTGQLVTAIEEGAQAVLDEALQDPALAGVEASGHLQLDGAAQAVLSVAADAALIVAGASGRGRISRAILGSTTRQLAHHAHCPIVVVPTT